MLDHHQTARDLRVIAEHLREVSRRTPRPGSTAILTLAAQALNLASWHASSPGADIATHRSHGASCDELAGACSELAANLHNEDGRLVWLGHQESLLGLADWHYDRVRVLERHLATRVLPEPHTT